MRRKVVFIAGWGRSGSTLLDSLLGQFSGFHSAGELRYLWDRGLIENRPCGCGVPLRQCPQWSGVLADYLKLPDEEVRQLVAVRDRFRTRDCLRLFDKPVGGAVEAYAQTLGDVVIRLSEATDSRVIVDSSKFPSHGFLLDRSGSIDLRVVHLVRDPRAVAYSWLRRKVYDTVGGTDYYIRPHGPSGSTVYWTAWNLIVERLWNRGQNTGRYLRLRYEDLIRQPRGSLERITALAGEQPPTDFFLDEDLVELKPSHMASGNPVRFQNGKVRLALDEEWRRAMPFPHRLVVTALAWPLLLRYGYLKNKHG